jgi:outer membrane protein TolC
MKQKLIYKKIFFIFSFFVCTAYLGAQEEKTYSYEDLKSELFKNNPQLLSLQEEYFRSTLDVKDAWASLGPTIDLQLSGTYMLNPPVDPIYLNVDELFGAIQWPNGIKPNGQGQYVKIYDGMENTMYNIQLSLMQPLFTWGKIGNSIKLYKQISGVKELQLLSTQEQLENELKIRLVTLCRLYEIIDLIEKAETFTNRMVEFSENAEKSGMMIHQDVVDAKVQAKQLEISKQEVNEQIKNQLLEIQKITGLQNLNRNQIDFSVDENEILSVMALNRTEVLENATSSQQKSIKMLSQLESINVLAEKIAKGSVNWKPDVALQVTGGYGGSRVPLFEPNWRRKDDFSLNISVGIKTTIWDGGKKVRDVSRKISETKTARINQTDARAQITQTLNAQWNTVDLCTLKIDYQNLKIESAEAKIKLKENEYQNGYGTEADVLNAKIDLCNQKIEKVKQTLSRDVACMTISFLSE